MHHMNYIILVNFCISGDHVIFTEGPSSAGIPGVYRMPDERAANPDRLNLDRYTYLWHPRHIYIN